MRSILTLLMAAGCVASLAFATSPEADAKKDTPVYQSASKRRVRLGGVIIGASYTRYSDGYGYYPYGYGPYWGGPTFWSSIYSPYWYSPWFHPGLYSGFGYRDGMGEVKLPTRSKSAIVYIDGAFAGTANKLRKMWLDPGAYDIEVRDGGHSTQDRVYVLSGKTVELRAGSEKKR